jgi:anaerobic ribonucleoside-triphosphate reductase activating protein
MIIIRYAQIREMDISNGEGIGVSLFTQGCSFHCKNCFNQKTWDYDKGKEWTKKIENKFLQLIDKSHITRVSFLGGDPLYSKNLNKIIELCNKIKKIYPNKVIWLYSGYKFEDIVSDIQRKNILKYIDILVDGQFINKLKNLNLKFRGSSNQRIIDVQKSLKENRIILYMK